MKSKQYPSEVYVLRKRVNLSSESSQLISGEAVNKIRMGRQVLKTRPKRSQPYSGKDTSYSITVDSFFLSAYTPKNGLKFVNTIYYYI